ncbi:hypothetical protein SAMN05216404_11086 [Nitrosospira multiformis]|uniref:Uncharacterized protein n=1 Tax=Nitrosospira multiformis TaxID=1231 RepID=A0A1H8LF77_9PROT|nr:hypothetical protein [Nitrosospira multiformis]SEO03852.1 hypothetical protein SAMN05216404_11086 [Nitrosospira multiformis]
MAARFLNTSSVLMCPHGGKVQLVSANTRVKAMGDYMLRTSDKFTITGCSLNIAGVPHPCVRVQWMQPATRSQVQSDSTLTKDNIGLCVAADQAVQGTVTISFAQLRVTGV